jgi:lysophospholipid acyltransferase (LPLAT)-like uncharacterized protein
MLNKLGKTQAVQEALGGALAGWIRLVGATNRWHREPVNPPEKLRPDWPVIVAMWHGQHFLVPLLRPHWAAVTVLISQHGDGEINSIACRHFGLGSIRGSGRTAASTKRAERYRGAQALRDMLNALEAGTTVALTADVPKETGIVGRGIITLARMSGRPIFPVAFATSRRRDLDSWDTATINFPFGRGALILGDPIRVAADASPDEMETARLAVQHGLDRAHARAYELTSRTPWRRAIA